MHLQKIVLGNVLLPMEIKYSPVANNGLESL